MAGKTADWITHVIKPVYPRWVAGGDVARFVNFYMIRCMMEIKRKWAMPNKRTFQIKPIKDLIKREKTNGLWLDPFPYPYKEDAISYMVKHKPNTVDGVLFDPPYSPRQLKECYNNLGMSLTDTTSGVWKQWKDIIARIVKPNGKVISFGWNSGGLGKNRGFKIICILLVAHGGNHNDTICVVEKKIQSNINFT